MRQIPWPTPGGRPATPVRPTYRRRPRPRPAATADAGGTRARRTACEAESARPTLFAPRFAGGGTSRTPAIDQKIFTIDCFPGAAATSIPGGTITRGASRSREGSISSAGLRWPLQSRGRRDNAKRDVDRRPCQDGPAICITRVFTLMSNMRIRKFLHLFHLASTGKNDKGYHLRADSLDIELANLSKVTGDRGHSRIMGARSGRIVPGLLQIPNKTRGDSARCPWGPKPGPSPQVLRAPFARIRVGVPYRGQTPDTASTHPALRVDVDGATGASLPVCEPHAALHDLTQGTPVDRAFAAAIFKQC